MVLQENSLSQSNERSYVFTHHMTDEDYRRSKQCKRKRSPYIGEAFSILQLSRYNISLQVYHFEYTVHPEKKIYIETNVKDIYMGETYPTAMKAALAFTDEPTQNMSAYFVHHVMQIPQVLRDTSDHKEIVSPIQIADTIKHSGVNNTYINLVYDCKNVCMQATLSNESYFMKRAHIKQDALDCVEVLANMSDVSEMLDSQIDDNSTDNIAIFTSAGIGVLLVAGGAFAAFVARSSNKFASSIRDRITSCFAGARKVKRDDVEVVQPELHNEPQQEHSELVSESTMMISQNEQNEQQTQEPQDKQDTQDKQNAQDTEHLLGNNEKEPENDLSVADDYEKEDGEIASVLQTNKSMMLLELLQVVKPIPDYTKTAAHTEQESQNGDTYESELQDVTPHSSHSSILYPPFPEPTGQQV